ncbi:hypothetical protein L3X38_004280 [Prunus dulcis]|uniref:Reverse transcriptase/retrotransposon-derived protein RNase H-like domain-containing protein n=1 Tax=Prunus dulcis TaxID=3755 RepID=A0AAD4ZNN7_PRUDU|nr:hypothetical protein L3X38_004280 [Prunus dulcis]
MDAYLGYDQILMHEDGKDAVATYQRLMNKIFKEQIGKTMEVYVYDMLSHNEVSSQNPCQIEAILEMKSPSTVKEIQSLTGRGSDPQPIPLEIYRQTYLTSPPLLSKPVPDEDLFLYLAVSDSAISSALIREEFGAQHPVFYTSKSLLCAETHYLKLEKAMTLLPSSLSHRHERLSFEINPPQPLCFSATYEVGYRL